MRLRFVQGIVGAFLALTFLAASAGQEIKGTVKKVNLDDHTLVLDQEGLHKDVKVTLTGDATFDAGEGKTVDIHELKVGDRITLMNAVVANKIKRILPEPLRGPLESSGTTSAQPLQAPAAVLLHGVPVPILKVKFDFPYVIYQGLTIYLLIAIGWHGGEELAELDRRDRSAQRARVHGRRVRHELRHRHPRLPRPLARSRRLRRIDKATVAGYYGSDSAGTFVTCLGVLDDGEHRTTTPTCR